MKWKLPLILALLVGAIVTVVRCSSDEVTVVSQLIGSIYSSTKCVKLSNNTVSCWSGHENNSSYLWGGVQQPGIAIPYTYISEGITRFAIGADQVCAVLTSGAIKCAGHNQYGELGNNSTTYSATPVDVSGITSGATAIAAGLPHTCAIVANGDVKCWGENWNGGLGDGTTNQSSVPVSVLGVTGATQLASGVYSNCALMTGGVVKCWGYGGVGQMGDGTTTANNSTPVIANLGGVATKISSGFYHYCAILDDATLKCWGFNNSGQLGDNSTTDRSTPVLVSTSAPVTDISLGYDHTCALLNTGAVECWGRNNSGQLGDGTTVDKLVPTAVTAVTTGVSQLVSLNAQTCVLMNDSKTVKCWGARANQDGTDSLTAVTIPDWSVAGTGTPAGLHIIPAGATLRDDCFPIGAFSTTTDGNLSSGVGADTTITFTSSNGSAILYTENTCTTTGGVSTMTSGKNVAPIYMKSSSTVSTTVNASASGGTTLTPASPVDIDIYLSGC